MFVISEKTGNLNRKNRNYKKETNRNSRTKKIQCVKSKEVTRWARWQNADDRGKKSVILNTDE